MGAARAAGCHGEAKRLPKLCATNGFVPRSAPGSPFSPLLGPPPTSPPAPQEAAAPPAPAAPPSSSPSPDVSVPLIHCLHIKRCGV